MMETKTYPWGGPSWDLEDLTAAQSRILVDIQEHEKTISSIEEDLEDLWAELKEVETAIKNKGR